MTLGDCLLLVAGGSCAVWSCTWAFRTLKEHYRAGAKLYDNYK